LRFPLAAIRREEVAIDEYVPIARLRLAVQDIDRHPDRLGGEERRVGAENAGSTLRLNTGDGSGVVGEGGNRHDLAPGVLKGLDGADAVTLSKDAVDLGVGGKQARNAVLLGTQL